MAGDSCVNCGRELAVREDGTLVHKSRRVALQLCTFLNTTVATAPAPTVPAVAVPAKDIP